MTCFPKALFTAYKKTEICNGFILHELRNQTLEQPSSLTELPFRQNIVRKMASTENPDKSQGCQGTNMNVANKNAYDKTDIGYHHPDYM